MILFYLLAFAIGVSLAVQPAVNASLAAQLDGSVVLASLTSFTVGTAFLIAVVLYTGGLGRVAEVIPAQPLWRLTGGLMGVFFIFCSIYLVPRIGIAPMVALVIAGQLAASLVMDHYGLIGVEVRQMSWPKLLGAGFVLSGMLLVLYGERLVTAMRGN